MLELSRRFEPATLIIKRQTDQQLLKKCTVKICVHNGGLTWDKKRLGHKGQLQLYRFAKCRQSATASQKSGRTDKADEIYE